MNRKFILSIASTAVLFACSPAGEKAQQKEDILRANIDSTVNPADDFFQYAEGTWLKNNPIPGDQTSWGIGQLVQEEIYARLRSINEDASKKNADAGIEKKIGSFWFSGMDSLAIEQNGINPLKEQLDRINDIRSPADVMSVASYLHTLGVGVFFSDYVSQDAKKSDQMAYSLYQGGLGLPNRDYYFNSDERTAGIRNAYPAYVAQIFSILGHDQSAAEQKAKNLIALETKLAKSSRTLEALRDPYANYNKMAVSRLSSLSPNINWPRHIQEMGAKGIDSVIIGQPEFFKQLDLLVNDGDLQTLKDYMAFHLIRSFAPYLNNAVADATFDFYSKLIRGAKQQKPRWKRVLDAEEDAMGEALGQLFAKEYFNETAKKRYEDIVENVRNAYRSRIEKLDWMTDSTKQKALHKLASIKKKVGYPDKWKDFSTLEIDKGPYVLNMLRANSWWNSYQMDKLGKPVDRDEWEMTPQTYNAYYNPSNNEIVLPAGIFTVPGYRDEELDDALVYGYAAASTVGHEITHGFDDEGRQFDENGNLRNWWTKKDEEEFNKRAQVLVDQFNNIVVVDTAHIKGKQTLGENLADLGGILIGLDAFKQTESYKSGKEISGLTALQRYFLGYALGWMYNIRNEQLASMVLTDVHAPAKYRVNGPMPNVPEFYEAFNVKPGDKMFLADSLRVRLW